MGSRVGTLGAGGASRGRQTGRPYADSSPFNTPIAGGAALYDDGVRTSASIISYLAAIAARPTTLIFNAGGTTADFAHPWYFALDSDPLLTLSNRYDSSHAGVYGGNFGAAETQGQQYRIPAAALPAGSGATTLTATGTPFLQPNEDSHMHVVQPNGVVLTMYRVERPGAYTNGGTIWCRWSAVEALTGDGLTRSDKAGSTAARFAGAPVFRFEELASRTLAHALFATSFRTRGLVAPATGQGTETVDTHAPPMGARLRYSQDHTFIDAQSWPTWVKDIMKALYTYGLYIGDTGGAATDALAFKGESDQCYRAFPSLYPTPLSESWAVANSVPSRVSGSLGRTVYELIFASYGIGISDFVVMQP